MAYRVQKIWRRKFGEGIHGLTALLVGVKVLSGQVGKTCLEGGMSQPGPQMSSLLATWSYHSIQDSVDKQGRGPHFSGRPPPTPSASLAIGKPS